MAAVLRTVLLDGIICQMDKVIVQILRAHGIRLARCPQIAFSEKVHVHVLGESDPDPDVKFSLVDEKGPLDVFLDDESL